MYSAVCFIFYLMLWAALYLDGANYIILLAHDAYDVPHKNKNDETDGSEEVFSYIL